MQNQFSQWYHTTNNVFSHTWYFIARKTKNAFLKLRDNLVVLYYLCTPRDKQFQHLLKPLSMFPNLSYVALSTYCAPHGLHLMLILNLRWRWIAWPSSSLCCASISLNTPLRSPKRCVRKMQINFGRVSGVAITVLLLQVSGHNLHSSRGFAEASSFTFIMSVGIGLIGTFLTVSRLLMKSRILAAAPKSKRRYD